MLMGKRNANKKVITWIILFTLVMNLMSPGMLVTTARGEGVTAITDAASGAAIVLGDVGGEVPGSTSSDAQPGGNNVWRVTGSFGDVDNWDPSNPNTVMSHLVGEYYQYSMDLLAGNYEFKFTKNSGSEWIGNKNGDNFNFSLAEPTNVIFYVNDELGEGDYHDKFRTNLPGLESQGLKQYTRERSDADWPRLVGDLQTTIGDEDNWSPSSAKGMFVDYYFNDSVYRLQRTLPKGAYECKVVSGDSWNGTDIGAPDGNLKVNIIDATADVTFSIDTWAEKKVLTHNYVPVDSEYDGIIDNNSLTYDSQSLLYKKPFGAIKQGQEDVRFRFGTKTGDAQIVRLEILDKNGYSSSYDMSIITVLDGTDYWEVTVAKEDFDEIGIWGYKFIVIDGNTKVEYGDDGISGGTGASSDEGQTPYNLTVYASDYVTPDWMKDAVVYQIFPDRFFDGDSTNNQAKTVDGSRGEQVQLFDGEKWSTIPENPRQSEEKNKPYYPDATTDGVWSNEFYGGDIKGIEEKLSYLQTLGVTAIYLNPVSWAASNHKYDATDYRHLDPMFGQPVYNTPGDPDSGLDYEATKVASDQVYTNFSKVCESLGIHLIVDGVFNHVGDDSIYFDRYENYPEIGAYEYWSNVWETVESKNVSQSQAEATVRANYKSQINPATGKNYTDQDFNYVDWFKVGPEKAYDEKTGEFVSYKYEGWWGYDSLPVIATVEKSETNLSNDSNASISGAHEYNNVDYREQVIGYDLGKMSESEAQKAMEEANSQRWIWMGSSGWRLDVAPDVSNETWQQFRTSVKSIAGKTDTNGNTIDDPIILGEEWNVATHYLLGDMFDSVMNYQFRAALQRYIINGGDAYDLNRGLETIRENYPKEAWQAMLNLVDSHDTVRNITKIDNPSWEEENIKIAGDASEKAVKLQALTAIFQLSYPGAPTIYYGDEVGVTGTKDPDSRRTFPWERVTENGDGSYQIATEYKDTYGDLFNAYVTAAEVRNTYKDLFATGDIKSAYAAGKVIAYARKSEVEGGMSIINTGAEEVEINADVKDFLPDGLILKDRLASGITGTVVNGTITLKVPGYTGMMMVSTTELSTLPMAPTLISAEAVNGVDSSVILNWSAIDGVEGYNIYRTLLEGKETEKINSAPITETTYTDTEVINGTKYYYYVKSVVGDTESVYSNVESALPSYIISLIAINNSIQNSDESFELGVGKKTPEIEVLIRVPGLTDNSVYHDKEIPGLICNLVYYLDGDSVESGLKTKLRYRADNDAKNGKIYFTTFEPTKDGTYKYFAQATMNHGTTYSESEKADFLTNLKADIVTPTSPNLAQPIQEASRVSLSWTMEDEPISGFEVYRKKNGDVAEHKIAVLEASARQYTDYMVSNDTQYSYRISTFNQDYGRSFSNIVSITPKLSMIEVTMRLTIPEKVYTSATDNIYIAGNINGWNASGWLLKKPSGATDNNIVEYTFTMMEGKSIEYKYTRGTWETEAFTSNKMNDTTSPGNYAYSSTDTNIKAIIRNQGGNKMIINDYVLRWVDMPMMIVLPRISYRGETIEYTTKESTFNLQASVPYGGVFTVNGKNINEISPDALDQYGNVRLDNIPLKKGLNTYTLHIEPSEETKAQPWLTDQGRITSQMTATTEIKITREGDEVVNPNPPSGGNNSGSTNPQDPKEEPKEEEKEVEEKKDWTETHKDIQTIIEKVDRDKNNKKATSLKIPMGTETVLPKDILDQMKGKNINLVLEFEDYTWTILGKSMKENAKISFDFDLKISLLEEKKDKDAVTKALNSAITKSKLKNKKIEIAQIEIGHKGKLSFDAELSYNVGKQYKSKYVYLSYYNEKSKKIEVADAGKVDKNGKVKLNFKKGAIHVITSENPVLPTVAKTRSVQKGKSYRLSPAHVLENAKITYQTSKKSVATISKTGMIKGIKKGTTTITIKVTQGGKTYTYKTKVTIK